MQQTALLAILFLLCFFGSVALLENSTINWNESWPSIQTLPLQSWKLDIDWGLPEEL